MFIQHDRFEDQTTDCHRTWVFNTLSLAPDLLYAQFSLPLYRPVPNTAPSENRSLVSPTGTNAQVVYSLTDSAEGHFSIDTTTGVIRLEKPLRARPQAALELTVRASDLGTPIPLSTLGTVTVSVVGLEDYLPVFLSPEHGIRVREDTPLGTEVLHLAPLTRPGSEKSGYRVVSGNEQGSFRLDTRTGERRMLVLGNRNPQGVSESLWRNGIRR